uniref:Uncharacterized protein n=1 Tax=Anabas testudineus TaxID=64144 RepID=A0A3Q1J7D4_ANATE
MKHLCYFRVHCVWNTSFGRRLAGGGGSPAPFTADLARLPAPASPPLTSSFSTKCSFVDLFFFLHGPSGMFSQRPCGPYLLPSFLGAFLGLFRPTVNTFPSLTCAQLRLDFVLRLSARLQINGVNIQQVGG